MSVENNDNVIIVSDTVEYAVLPKISAQEVEILLGQLRGFFTIIVVLAAYPRAWCALFGNIILHKVHYATQCTEINGTPP